MDEFLRNERRGQEHVDRHRESVLASHAFHSNRNSMHTYRHDRAVHYRDAMASERRQRLGDLAHKKKHQTESFLERRDRLLIDVAGDESAKA